MSKLWEQVKEAYGTWYCRIPFWVAAVVGSTHHTVQFAGEPWYHVSGLITTAVAHAVDSASTKPIIELMNDPKYRKYGLHNNFYEKNPLIGKRPTMNRYKKGSLVSGTIQIIGGTLFPGVGYTYLASSPIIASRNRDSYLEMRLQYEIIERLPEENKRDLEAMIKENPQATVNLNVSD